MNNIEAIRFREIVRPLRTTFSTSLGQKQNIRSVLITVTLTGGATGIGEVPTSFAFADETVDVIRRALSESNRLLKQRPVHDYAEHIKKLREKFPHARMTLSGLEVALFRAWLQSINLSESPYWGCKATSITTDITIPFLTDTSLLGRWLAYTATKGFTVYKLKVSGDIDRDKHSLSFVWQYLRRTTPGFRLRLDGNQGYTAPDFIAFLDYAGKMGYEIELFEQPLRKDDFKGLEVVCPRSSVPLILDESILSVEDARRAIDNGLCHGFNVKIAKSGIHESAGIAALAKEHGMKLMIGCMTETMAGLSAAIFMAAGTKAFDFIDLDSIHFLYGSHHFGTIRTDGPNFLIDQNENWVSITSQRGRNVP